MDNDKIISLIADLNLNCRMVRDLSEILSEIAYEELTCEQCKMSTIINLLKEKTNSLKNDCRNLEEIIYK